MMQRRLKKLPYLLLLLFLPAAAILAIHYFSGEVEGDLSIPVAVVDQDQSDLSKTLIKRLKQQERLELEETGSKEAQNLLLREETDTVFIIKNGFEEAVNNGDREELIELRTTPLSVASGVVREMAASEIIRLTSNAKAADRVEKLADQYNAAFPASGNLRDEAYQYADQQWEPEPLMTIEYNEAAVSGAQMPETGEKAGFLPGPLQIWTAITLVLCMISCDWIIKERDALFKRITTTPAGLNEYMLKSFGFIAAVHLLQGIVSWTITRQLDPSAPLSLLFPMSIFILFTMSVQLLIAAFSAYPGNYYTASTVWIFLISLFGGSILPAGEILPQLKEAEKWFPQGPVLAWRSGAGPALYVFMLLGAAFIFTAMSRLRRTR
ncbi:hypothetical protein GKZ89_14800 [Bacillus mangrovi]|uniref:ABC-2 type transporter transmembrane domain-containing protein n=1 Tax=Metabacillus mangrovi TaxID=1491830 RepID=A0A7X2S6P9_9BACI|nr:ABC transporter permease [Metabacillus mangrovi]MTH54669.1 hypothetical protein [Metabacillus mangrovi]